MVLLALRPELPTSARMPPTAHCASRGGRPGLAVLTAGLVVPLGRLSCRLGGVRPCPPGETLGIESLGLRAPPMHWKAHVLVEGVSRASDVDAVRDEPRKAQRHKSRS